MAELIAFGIECIVEMSNGHKCPCLFL